VLVVPIPEPDSGAPLQGVSGVEGPAEDPVGGGAEADWEVERPVEDPGPLGRWEMQPGGAGIPRLYGRGETGAGRGGGRSERGVRGGAAGVGGGAEAGELGAPGWGGDPLFLPTPDS